jgi:DNA polymerase-3 subunit epsilon|tara:strand:- start:1752 stop:2546 length:795 start_codon:yes stop_codon:yes gene_type:complete
MKLKKSLVIIDLETTGLDVINDRIIEISMIKIDINNKETNKTIRINPEIPISRESSLIHGLYYDDIKNCPSFKKTSKEIFEFINKYDIGGFNVLKFDLPMLIEEFLRCGIHLSIENINIIDAQRIYHLMEKRNLSSAYKFYCNKELKNAHNSYYDTLATYEVIKSQIKKYNGKEVVDNKGKVLGKISNNIDSIGSIIDKNIVDLAGRIVKNTENIEVFNFGKFKDKNVNAIFKSNPEYYHWIMKSSFSLNTKENFTRIRLKGIS